MKPVLIRHIHGRQVLEQQRQQVGHDEQADPAVYALVKITGDFRVQQPGVKPLPQRQVGGDVRARLAELDAHKLGSALRLGVGVMAGHQKLTSVARPA